MNRSTQQRAEWPRRRDSRDATAVGTNERRTTNKRTNDEHSFCSPSRVTGSLFTATGTAKTHHSGALSDSRDTGGMCAKAQWCGQNDINGCSVYCGEDGGGIITSWRRRGIQETSRSWLPGRSVIGHLHTGCYSDVASHVHIQSPW